VASREIPGAATAFKVGCGVVSLVVIGAVVLLVSILTSSCGEAKDVLSKFRSDVKAGEVAHLSMEQSDDAAMRKAVASSSDQSVSGFESVSGAEDWICIHGTITTADGTKDLDVLASRKGKAPWVVAGASLALQCRIKRGGPRFIQR
jgi:hypothetical protein